MGVSKGYGYVQFRTEDDASGCIKKLNGMCIQEQTIYISKFVSKADRTNNSKGQNKFTNVYIKNLPSTFDENDMHVLFDYYGDITSLKVCYR